MFKITKKEPTEEYPSDSVEATNNVKSLQLIGYPKARLHCYGVRKQPVVLLM